MRIALLAEGTGELRSSFSDRVAPRHPIPEAGWGAGHHLVARCLEADRGLGRAGIVFVEPLHDKRGRLARGSDLLGRSSLRRLLAWPSSPPDLLVVLVDEDGERGRLPLLRGHVAGLLIPELAFGVAVREFEAWLISDEACLRGATGCDVPPQNPEGLAPGEAKEFLRRAIRSSSRASEELQVRVEIARDCDLEAVSRKCSSFRSFRQKLNNPPPLPGDGRR